MKKLDLSNIVEGVRRLGAVKATFEHMQEAMIEGFAAVLKGLTSQSNGAVAIFGIVDSGGGAPNYNISAGWIYYQGELYEVDAFSGAAGGGQVPILSLATTHRVGDPVIYSDANSFNTHAIRKLVWSFGTSGTGLADYSQVLRLANLMNTLIDVQGQINAVIDAAPGALDTLNELAAALGDDPNFAATVTTALAGKLSNAAGAVGNSNLATDSVTASKIQNGQVGSVKVDTSIAITPGPIGGIDANTISAPGIYHIGSNGPTSDSFTAIVSSGVSPTIPMQAIAIQRAGAGVGDIYARIYSSGSWGSWTLINDASA